MRFKLSRSNSEALTVLWATLSLFSKRFFACRNLTPYFLMNTIPLLLLALLGHLQAFEYQDFEDKKTDELLSLLEQADENSNRLSILVELARRPYELDAVQRKQFCQDALVLIGDSKEKLTQLSTIQNAMGTAEMQEGQLALAIEHFLRSMQTAEEAKSKRLEFNARSNLAIALSRNNAADEEVDSQYSWLMSHMQHSTPDSAIAVRVNYAKFLIELDREFEAMGLLDEAQRRAIELEQWDSAMIATIILSGNGMRLEAFGSTQRCLARLRVHDERLPDNERKKILDCFHWMVEANLGRPDVAMEQLDSIISTTDLEAFTPFYRRLYLLAKSEILLAMNRPEIAATFAEKSLAASEGLDERYKFPSVVVLAQSYIELGRLSEAEELIESYQGFFDKSQRLKHRLIRRAEQIRLHNRQRTTFIVLGLATLSLVGILIWHWFKRKHEKALLKKERQLSSQLSELVQQRTASLESEFKQKVDLDMQLAERNSLEVLGGLVGNFAHDMNNLLHVIRNSNELVELELGQRQRATLTASNQCIDTASRTIQQLLAYSKKQNLQPQHFQFSNYIQNHLEIFRSALPEKIKLICNDDSQGATIRIDECQLTNALLNLICNSSDAMPFGGEIELSAALDHSVFGEGFQGERTLIISIKDNGEGMSEETLNRAFEPYYTTKGSDAGTGLGLSSVMGFVKQSGGMIWLESNVNSGTLAKMQFPIVKKDVTSRRESRLDEVEDLEGFSILLVEDNELVASSLKVMLQLLNAEYQHVESAGEAVELLSQSHSFNFVISDISMLGKMDGLGLAHWIRHNSPRLEFLLITGRPDNQTDDYPVLQKPFTLKRLLASIHRKEPTAT